MMHQGQAVDQSVTGAELRCVIRFGTVLIFQTQGLSHYLRQRVVDSRAIGRCCVVEFNGCTYHKAQRLNFSGLVSSLSGC